MADTKKYGWNVQIDGVQYLVEYMKGSIFINGGEAFKLRSLERTGTLRKDKQLSYTVPLAGKELNLVISAVSGISLIMDGMDLGTYPDGAGANQKAPAWIVVFYVNVGKLCEDTIMKPDEVIYNKDQNVMIYKKEYPFNISTSDTPTGTHRVFIPLNTQGKKTIRMSQFPLVGGN